MAPAKTLRPPRDDGDRAPAATVDEPPGPEDAQTPAESGGEK